jgi:RNA-directed DNA polymerase
MLKKSKLRYNEYYNMQNTFDELYHQSKNGNKFYKLFEIITSEQNIRLAFRNIKTNKGSKTPGTDGKTIEDVKRINNSTLINEVRNCLNNYKPQSVRRVFIEKEGSKKKRPLGIPTIWNRIVEQCILQVMEPICEAKFHNHSYGFRANRNTHNALSRVVSLINVGNYYYCVDVDIHSFFDNVNHGKLLKQIWTLGIRDKRIISIISKILKSEIEGEGIPTKGTTQGGVLSPLLSLIVLNELDWWASSQWETYKPHRIKNIHDFHGYARKYTKMKSGFIVRYADDFKIMCRTYEEAKRFYYAVTDFLKVRLQLDISSEKSKVVNLKKSSSNFLGFKIKVLPKGKTRFGFVAKTDMSNKAITKVKDNLKNKVKEIQKTNTIPKVIDYNSAVIGIQNYYKYATNIYNNITDINYSLLKTIKVRLGKIAKVVKFEKTPIKFRKQCVGIRKYTKIYTILNKEMLPITGVHHKNPFNFQQHICNFTVEGREKIHKDLNYELLSRIKYFINNYSKYDSIEFNDNRISKYFAQYGKCYVLKEVIESEKIYCYHKVPLGLGGTDKYNNLIIINREIYKLINETNSNNINNLIQMLLITRKKLDVINKLRIFANIPKIAYKFT